MSEQNNRDHSLMPRNQDPGFMRNLADQFRLVLRLMGDSRVSPILKLLPVGTVVYLLFPDLVIGPLDDIAVIGLGTYGFIEMAPADVVEEHRAALRGESIAPDESLPDDIVEGEFSEAASEES